MADTECIDAAPVAQASPRITHIYVLKDPRDGAVRYVGKTAQDLSTRLIQHLSVALRRKSPTYVAKWIRSLQNSGAAPLMEQIDEALDDWAEREAYWIDWYWAQGAKLTNATAGGEGIPGLVHTPATRAIMSEKAKIRFASPEDRIIVGMARRGKKDSPEQLLRKRVKGRVHTEQARANMSAGRLGIPCSDAAKANMSVAALARHARDPEAAERHSALMKAKYSDPDYVAKVTAIWADPEYRAKRRAEKKAQSDNPEFRAKMSAIMTIEMARRKAVRAAQSQEASLERSDDLSRSISND